MADADVTGCADAQLRRNAARSWKVEQFRGRLEEGAQRQHAEASLRAAFGVEGADTWLDARRRLHL